METLDLQQKLVEVGARVEVASKRHARDLSRVMRAKDRDEVMASGNLPPEKAVRLSINRSVEAYALYCEDDLLAVFGVGSLHQGHAPWMLTGDAVDSHPKVFWQSSKAIIDYLRGRYPLLMNMVHGKNTQVLRWAERLGFTLSPPERWGSRGDLFCRITMVTQSIILDPNSDEFSAAREVLGV